jgi:PleD family two-component response regulator
MVAKFFRATGLRSEHQIVSATKRVRPLLNQKRDGHFLEYLLRGLPVRDVVPRRTTEQSVNSRKGRRRPDRMKDQAPAQRARTSLRILAVDDEPSTADCLSLIFEQPRYELTRARDGNDALVQLSAAVPYDVVITDNEMPTCRVSSSCAS